MPPLSSPRIVAWLLQALPTCFLAILFLQSGIDKVIDFRGNQGYLTQHFGKSPLRGVVTPMLLTLTVVEVSAGALCAVGLVELLVLGVPAHRLLGHHGGGVWRSWRSSSASGSRRTTPGRR